VETGFHGKLVAMFVATAPGGDGDKG